MASIKRYETVNGVAYKIVISNGYDLSGNKIVTTTTYKPDTTLSKKQQEKAALKYANQFEDKFKSGKIFDGDNLSFEEFVPKWLKQIENNVAYSTYKSYTGMLKNKIIPYFKAYKLTQIKLPMVEAFYLTLAKDYARGSIKKCDIILNGIFKTAIRWQMIETNPCAGAIIPKTVKKKELLKYFTPGEALAFLSSLDMTFEYTYKGHNRVDDTGIPYVVGDYTESRCVHKQHKIFYNIALFCGLRKGEILALHWDDIDFEKRTININKAISKTEKGLDYCTPKTVTSIRKVPLPTEIIPVIKEYKREYDLTKMELGDYWKGNGNIFIQSDGRLMGYTTPYQYFKRHIKRYNEWVLNSDEAKQKKLSPLPDIPLHGLRHSCATLLNYLNVNITTISNILGHAQTSTTMNIYAHSFDEPKWIASDKIDEFLRASV